MEHDNRVHIVRDRPVYLTVKPPSLFHPAFNYPKTKETVLRTMNPRALSSETDELFNKSNRIIT